MYQPIYQPTARQIAGEARKRQVRDDVGAAVTLGDDVIERSHIWRMACSWRQATHWHYHLATAVAALSVLSQKQRLTFLAHPLVGPSSHFV